MGRFGGKESNRGGPSRYTPGSLVGSPAGDRPAMQELRMGLALERGAERGEGGEGG
jgi:hypothetical protein